MKKSDCGKYQRRFENLWAIMITVDAKKAGEISGELIAGIIGCSADYAERLLLDKLRLKRRCFDEINA